MGTIWIKELVGGLDARRLRETTAGGQLIRGSDGHITRGGEFEKRAAFVKAFDLPPGTVSLGANATSLIVFGKDADPGVPTGIAYERLDDGDSDALVRVLGQDLYDGKIYAVAEYADGSLSHFYDEVEIADWFDGRARFSFDVIDGQVGGGMASVTVGGIEVLGATVSWDTDVETTAAAIAAQVNSHTSAPEYVAVAVGNRVTIIAATAGTTANGLAVTLSMVDMATNPASGVMAGGATSSAAFQPGRFVKTISRKMFALSGTIAHFSGLDQPTKFNTEAIGAGFVDMSKEDRLESDLIGVATYNQYVAIFSARSILIYFFDPDPALTRKSQVLANTGTAHPRTITQFGDADVFYLDTTGLRSLRARDSSQAAATSDIGIPVDELVRAEVEALVGDDLNRVFGVIEPRDGRFWLIIKDRIYVFSYFPGSRVSAWTTYTPGFIVDDVVVFRGRIYLRSGDAIYVYGGLTPALTYDATESEVWFPFLDANKPTDEKTWTAVDAAVRGTWEVRMGFNVNNEDASDKIATITETTYGYRSIPAQGRSTHASLRMRSQGEGYAKLGAAVIHYEDADAQSQD